MKKFALSGSAQDPEKYAEDMLHILDGRLGVQLPDASKEAGWAGDAGNWLRNTGGAVKDTVMNQANRMGLAPGNAVRDAQNFGNQAVGTAKGFVNQAVGAGKEFMSGLRGQQPAAAAAAPKPQVGPKPMAGPGYQVQQGDTMSGLAKRQGMSLQDLMTRNPGITNPNVINKGQAINFGTAGNAPAAKPQKARTHEAPQMAAKQQPVPNPTAPAPAAPQNAASTPPTWMNPPAAAQNMSVQPKTAAEKAAMSLLELYGKVQKGETKVPVPKHLSPMQAATYSRHYVELANPKTRRYAMRGMRNILGAAKKIKEGPAMPKAAAALVTTKEALFGARARRAAAQRENDDVLHEMSNKEVAMHGGLRGGLGGLLAGGIAGAVHRSEGGSGLSTAGLVGGGTLLGTGVGAGAALLRKNYIKAKRQAEAKRTEQPMPKAAALNPSEMFPASKRDVAGMMDKSHALAKKFPVAAADSMSRLSAASGRNRLAAFNLHDKKVPSLSHLKQIEKRETLQKLIGWKRDSLSKGLEQKAASMLEKAALQDETLTKLKALARAHKAIPFVPGKNPELSRKMFDLAARQRRHIDDVTAGRGVFPGSEGKVLFHNALRRAAEAKGLSGVKTLGKTATSIAIVSATPEGLERLKTAYLEGAEQAKKEASLAGGRSGGFRIPQSGFERGGFRIPQSGFERGVFGRQKGPGELIGERVGKVLGVKKKKDDDDNEKEAGIGGAAIRSGIGAGIGALAASKGHKGSGAGLGALIGFSPLLAGAGTGIGHLAAGERRKGESEEKYQDRKRKARLIGAGVGAGVSAPLLLAASAMRRHLLKNAGYAGHDSGNGKNFGNALRKMLGANRKY